MNSPIPGVRRESIVSRSNTPGSTALTALNSGPAPGRTGVRIEMEEPVLAVAQRLGLEGGTQRRPVQSLSRQRQHRENHHQGLPRRLAAPRGRLPPGPLSRSAASRRAPPRKCPSRSARARRAWRATPRDHWRSTHRPARPHPRLPPGRRRRRSGHPSRVGRASPEPGSFPSPVFGAERTPPRPARHRHPDRGALASPTSSGLSRGSSPSGGSSGSPSPISLIGSEVEGQVLAPLRTARSGARASFRAPPRLSPPAPGAARTRDARPDTRPVAAAPRVDAPQPHPGDPPRFPARRGRVSDRSRSGGARRRAAAAGPGASVPASDTGRARVRGVARLSWRDACRVRREARATAPPSPPPRRGRPSPGATRRARSSSPR